MTHCLTPLSGVKSSKRDSLRIRGQTIFCDVSKTEHFNRTLTPEGLVGVYMGILSMPIDEAAETPKCSSGTSNTVYPFDISPVPNFKKRTTTRGRKATRSSLITGSPYKNKLTKSLEKSAPKK
ncbi:hypothetical protein AVEN_194611-1 [Araneus ventricosus]|uniref:Uncharacterized protein n=1 Tax=Araneus ventricosus TaxID=182803 RepID=A0A4Y2A7Y5_ARAVE|nr:hypothetical protein AVEN_194611-1 [Araneus ventricosus]